MTKKIRKVADGLPPATLNDVGKLSHSLLALSTSPSHYRGSLINLAVGLTIDLAVDH
jgi:hypothetical protein